MQEQLVIQIINAVKWPMVFIIITIFALILFRRPINELLLYIKFVKYRNLELTFGREVKQLEKDATNLPCSIDVRVADGIKATDTVKVEKALPFDTSDRYVQLAKIDPMSAIMDAWRNLQLAIFDKASEFKIREHSISRIVNKLSKKGILEPVEKTIFDKLYKLRNEAMYIRGFNLNFIDAITYAYAAKELADCIKNKK